MTRVSPGRAFQAFGRSLVLHPLCHDRGRLPGVVPPPLPGCRARVYNLSWYERSFPGTSSDA